MSRTFFFTFLILSSFSLFAQNTSIGIAGCYGLGKMNFLNADVQFDPYTSYGARFFLRSTIKKSLIFQGGFTYASRPLEGMSKARIVFPTGTITSTRPYHFRQNVINLELLLGGVWGVGKWHPMINAGAIMGFYADRKAYSPNQTASSDEFSRNETKLAGEAGVLFDLKSNVQLFATGGYAIGFSDFKFKFNQFSYTSNLNLYQYSFNLGICRKI